MSFDSMDLRPSSNLAKKMGLTLEFQVALVRRSEGRYGCSLQ